MLPVNVGEREFLLQTAKEKWIHRGIHSGDPANIRSHKDADRCRQLRGSHL
jgi:hypothetical protein